MFILPSSIVRIAIYIRLKGELTRAIFKKLSQKQSTLQYRQLIFRVLVQMQFIKNSGSIDLSNKILTDIDRQGKYLRSMELLGVNGVQVGPVSQSADGQEGTLGIKGVKANINAYRQEIKQKQKQKSKSKSKSTNIRTTKQDKQLLIGVAIQPNTNVLQFTPYMIPQNVITCTKQITGIPQDIAQADQKIQFIKKTHGNIITDRELNVLLPKFNNNIIDFITINSQIIKDKLGDQNNTQTHIILKEIFKKIVSQMAYTKNIKVFQKKNNQHYVVFYPTVDRYGQSTKGQKHQFISVQELINQIIRD